MSGKNPGKLAFKQGTTNVGKAGKTSAKKSPGKLGFTQKTAAKTGNSTKKNPSRIPVVGAGSNGGTGVKYAKKGVTTPMAKQKKGVKVTTPAFKSIDQVVAFRKGKYNV